MPTSPRAVEPLVPAAPRLGDPAYSLMTLVAGTMISLGAQATAYMSSISLAPLTDAAGA